MLGKISKSEWFVAQLTSGSDIERAREMIREQHYAKGVGHPYALVHGLFNINDTDNLYGVAWWIPPIKNAAISVARYCNCPDDVGSVLNLSRLVVDTSVPGNGASFLLGGSIRDIKKTGKWKMLVTYADTYRGHSGAIYKATNWDYVGTTVPEPIWVDPQTGGQVSKKQDRHTYTRQQMEEMGYECIGKSIKHKFVLCLE